MAAAVARAPQSRIDNLNVTSLALPTLVFQIASVPRSSSSLGAHNCCRLSFGARSSEAKAEATATITILQAELEPVCLRGSYRFSTPGGFTLLYSRGGRQSKVGPTIELTELSHLSSGRYESGKVAEEDDEEEAAAATITKAHCLCFCWLICQQIQFNSNPIPAARLCQSTRGQRHRN